MESETLGVCSWCKRPIEASADGATAAVSNRPDLHFLSDGESDSRSYGREIAIGLMVSAVIMGGVLIFLFKGQEPAKPPVSSEIKLSAERNGPPEPPVITAAAPTPGAGNSAPMDPGDPAAASAAVFDDYMLPPVIKRADGREPVAQASKRTADSLTPSTGLGSSGPKAYIESADVLIARVDSEATVTASVVVVNLEKRPIVKYELTLDLNGMRTRLVLAPENNRKTTVPPSSSIEVKLIARTLVNDEDVKGRKRVLLDAWYDPNGRSSKDGLVVGQPKAKKQG